MPTTDSSALAIRKPKAKPVNKGGVISSITKMVQRESDSTDNPTGKGILTKVKEMQEVYIPSSRPPKKDNTLLYMGIGVGILLITYLITRK